MSDDEMAGFDTPGQVMPFHERMALLIVMVGGPGRAAQLAGVDPDTVANWRKEGARVPILKLLPIAEQAGVSLDWVATGHQTRPDLLGASRVPLAEPDSPAPSPGFVQLMPVEPEIVGPAGRTVQRWTPSEVSVSAQWLHESLGVPAEWARYGRVGDEGMEPLLTRDALVIVDFRPDQPLGSGIYLVGVGPGEWLARRLNRWPDGSGELVADAISNWSFPIGRTAGLRAYRILWAGQRL